MKRAMPVTWVKFIAGILLIAGIGSLPCPEGLTREAMKYMGVFAGMLFYLLVNLCAEYVIILFSLGLCVILDVERFEGIFASFSGSTVWLLIGVLPLSCAIAGSGLMRRIALHVLKLFPNTYKGQLLALSAAGITVSPMIPSITAKASILAPFSVNVAEEMKFAPKSKGMTGFFIASYLMGAVSGHVFYSGSMNVFIMTGLLPENMQDTFSWGGWLLLTCIWGLCIYVLGYAAITVLYKPENGHKLDRDYIPRKIMELGPMTAAEKKVLAVLLLTLAGWITRSIHGISEAAIAILAYVILVLLGVADKKEFRRGVAWDMIIFIGGLMCMAGIMTDLGIDTWLAGILSPIIRPMLVNEYVYVVCLSLLVAVCRYFIVSPISAVSLFYVIFAGPAQAAGIQPWVTVFVITTVAQLWSTPYNNTTYLASVAVVGDDMLNFKEVVKMSHMYVMISVVGFLLSIPLWKHLGMII